MYTIENECHCKADYRVSMKIRESHISGFLGSWARYYMKFRVFQGPMDPFQGFQTPLDTPAKYVPIQTAKGKRCVLN